MDIYDLIRDKEWSALTEAERDALQEIAADEKTYNLLKIMMQVAEDEKESVPATPPQIYKDLVKQFPQKRKQRFTAFWPIAASVIGIVILTLIWVNRNPSEPKWVKNQLDTIQNLKNIATTKPVIESVQPDSTQIQTIPSPPKQVQIAKTVKPKKQIAIENNTEKESIETRIAYEPQLLTLVTELY